MLFNVNRIVENKDFDIIGVSYIGSPKSNTAMYVSKKVENLLSALAEVNECLIFAETGITIPESLKKHAFHFSDNPQLSYSEFANQFAEEQFAIEKGLKFSLSPRGYFVCEDVVIPDDSYIEAGCIIGPDVELGKNAKLLAGTVIKHTSVGDNFLSNEYAVIGANGFTTAKDANGNLIRIPNFGRVIIGNDVEVGAQDNISRGSVDNTVIEDHVKIDALVHIGHDVHLERNVEITAGAIIGGFDHLGAYSYVGINAVLRNRINIGNNAIIGMGATVTKSVDEGVTVAGNPARLFVKTK